MDYGDIEKSVRIFVKKLAPLRGPEFSLARIAFRLARSLDDANADERTLASISKELRAILEKLQEGRSAEDELGLDAPV